MASVADLPLRRPLRVGLVDDHPPILRGVLVGLAEHYSGPLAPVAASTVAELLATATELDVVLLDVQLGDGSLPEENVRQVLARGWPVLLYTQETNRAVVARCFKAGAAGIVGKHEDMSTLADAIGVLLSGEPYLNGEWAAAIEDDPTWQAPELTQREAEALRLYAMGLTMKSVARRMGVAADTAKEYLLRTRRKYAAVGRPAVTKTDLYIRAVEDGLLPRPVDGA